MWTVRYAAPGERKASRPGKPGWQADGSYLTPEGQRLATELERAAYLRTVQDWVIRPQVRTVRGVAGVDSIGGYEKQYHVQPDPTKLTALDLSFGDVARALQANNANQGARYLEDNGEGYVVRSSGRLESMDEIGNVVVTTRGGVPVRVKDIAEVRIGRDLRTGSASEDGREAVVGYRPDAHRREQPHGRGRRRRQDARDPALAPAGHRVQTVLDGPVWSRRPSGPWRRTSPRERPSSSSSCSCCSATSAPPSSLPW